MPFGCFVASKITPYSLVEFQGQAQGAALLDNRKTLALI